ncbi:MAG: isoprenylcysteine carboxylmethyltransferase family protein [Succinivibrionaceae bacterium]|nr:isoprenylcysteine carboxylmethyltransferase family protein [Succinivibrionaceae bacterium]
MAFFSFRDGRMPLAGIGPLFAPPVALTAAAPFFWLKESADIFAPLAVPSFAAGVLLLIYAFQLWFRAVFVSKMVQNVLGGRLMTEGAYAVTRNPVYTAILAGGAGLILLSGNLFFLLLTPLWWLWLILLLRAGEEKWLRRTFGADYEEYCARVPRCIPRLRRLF